MGQAAQKSDLHASQSRFVVGRDTQGRWVVCDQRGLVGGLFSNRDSAVHFAEFESDHAPGAVCCAPDDAVVTLAGLSESRRAAPTPRRFARA
jgi:hypothetical protein